MEERLSLLKSTFGEIVDIKESNLNILLNLEARIKKIKTIYNEFITTNRDNLFVFTLDSFRFQSKFIDLEFEDTSRMLLSITNRMYCDYYKLFKIIVKYIEENIPDKKIIEVIRVNDNFPAYKDLEPFKQYDFKYIQGLHEIILVILNYIHTYITNKDHDLKLYQSKNQIGLNIDSFVSTFSFNNVVMNQRAMLFITYVEFFHKMHTKYLKRFTTKVNLMLSQINNDIKLDSSAENKTTKHDTINELKEQNLDKKLLREIKVSILDDASISSSDHSDPSKTPTMRNTSLSDAGSNDSNTYTEDIHDNTIYNGVSNEKLSELTDDIGNKEKPRYSIEKMAPINNLKFTTIDMISNREVNESTNTPDNTPVNSYSELLSENSTVISIGTPIESPSDSPFEKVESEVSENSVHSDNNDNNDNTDKIIHDVLRKIQNQIIDANDESSENSFSSYIESNDNIVI